MMIMMKTKTLLFSFQRAILRSNKIQQTLSFIMRLHHIIATILAVFLTSLFSSASADNHHIDSNKVAAPTQETQEQPIKAEQGIGRLVSTFRSFVTYWTGAGGGPLAAPSIKVDPRRPRKTNGRVLGSITTTKEIDVAAKQTSTTKGSKRRANEFYSSMSMSMSGCPPSGKSSKGCRGRKSSKGGSNSQGMGSNSQRMGMTEQQQAPVNIRRAAMEYISTTTTSTDAVAAEPSMLVSGGKGGSKRGAPIASTTSSSTIDEEEEEEDEDK